MFRGVIGRITPSGTVSEFPIATAFVPSGITEGPDGSIWFSGADTDGFNGTIRRITPSGKITFFHVPIIPSRVNGFPAAPDANLWFTHDENPSQNRKIGRITLTC